MSSTRTFFGHPRGLATLFFTEMWERFSYYGMRALLILYMVAAVERGGMGLDDRTAGAIYGLYTMFVYLLALPGGWLADNFFGLRKSVFYGGCLIAAGHLSMAFASTETFFIGLLLIILGTGLLKPNISSLVGEIYPAGDPVKRDAGFSIFYMGINIGGFLAPLIVGYLGQKVDWHYGFGAAGIGMIIGVIQYKLTEKSLGTAGLEPMNLVALPNPRAKKQAITKVLSALGLGLVVLVGLLISKTLVINPITFASASGIVILLCAILYFMYVLRVEKLDNDEWRKVLAIFILFLVTIVFYGGYEGQGSTLNLFADRYTNMLIGTFEMPASWLQAFPSLFVVVFVPVFAALWAFLAKHKLNPSTPVKMALGLFWMGAGYLVMVFASNIVIAGGKPLPMWLIVTYMLHTFGEIFLYPIGLSGVTKLSPKRLVGQMMGVFFMALALGNLMAGMYAGEFNDDAIMADPTLLTDLFGLIVKIMLVATLLVFIFLKPIRKLMGNIT